MQPAALLDRHLLPATAADGLVIGIVATGPGPLEVALGRLASAPDLLAVTARIVVVGSAAPAEATSAAAAALPVGLLRVVQHPSGDRPGALARLLGGAVAESAAGSVLILDDLAVGDAAVLLDAFERARRSPAADVVALRDPAAVGTTPHAWWGVVIPLDAVRAVGSIAPEAGRHALAELALRAEAAGFRWTVLHAPGPAPARGDDAGHLVVALLHEPVRARSGLSAAGLLADARDMLALRPRLVEQRHAALRALLVGPHALRASGLAALPGGTAQRLRFAALPAESLRLHARLWRAWPALRRRYRHGALDRAAVGAWDARFARTESYPPRAGAAGGATAERAPGLRFPAWPTSSRGTSAA